jgi:hypothetical protein
MTTSFYSVWVGGGEVNDYPLTYAQAQEIARQYRKDGYDDVAIEKLKED